MKGVILKAIRKYAIGSRDVVHPTTITTRAFLALGHSTGKQRYLQPPCFVYCFESEFCTV